MRTLGWLLGIVLVATLAAFFLVVAFSAIGLP
jgi:hypothetical protein